MPDQILYTGMKPGDRTGGPNPFRGLEGMPEFPILEGTDAYLEHSQKLIFTLEQQVKSIKANAPLVLNPEDHPDLEFVTQWVHTKLAILKPGDIFDLPSGYEFKKGYQYHSSKKFYRDADWVDCDESQYESLLRIECMVRTVLRIVKTEVKDETPPLLKFKFDPLAELTYDEWEKMSKIKRPENTKDNKAWAGAWLEGEMSGYAKCMIDKVLSQPEPEESQKELRQATHALNAIDFLNRYAHGIINGKRHESLEMDLCNAKDHLEKLYDFTIQRKK